MVCQKFVGPSVRRDGAKCQLFWARVPTPLSGHEGKSVTVSGRPWTGRRTTLLVHPGLRSSRTGPTVVHDESLESLLPPTQTFNLQGVDFREPIYWRVETVKEHVLRMEGHTDGATLFVCKVRNRFEVLPVPQTFGRETTVCVGPASEKGH